MMMMRLIVLLFDLCIAWSPPGKGGKNLDRRSYIKGLALCPILTAASHNPKIAWAGNLPQDMGADLSQTGTVETLVPIINIRSTLVKTEMMLSQQTELSKDVLLQAQKMLASIPTSEVDFKRLFDRYSDPVSYKQKFLDQNAFLVYYTRGFDGPGRPSIESDLPLKQSLQFGTRNDAWSSWDALQAEIDFCNNNKNSLQNDSSPQELVELLQATITAVDAYLSYAPTQDVEDAIKR